jgi:hypothetical protein
MGGLSARVLTTLTVLVALGFIAGAFLLLSPDSGDDDSGNDGDQTPAAVQSSVTPTTPDTSGADARAECQNLLTRQAQVTVTADQTMAQWRLHIDAMNQLVAGVIDLDQATAFWQSSEDAAKRRIAAFERADAALRSDTVRCVPPADKTCRTATRKWSHVLAAARPAADTWMHHIHDMDALMAGEVTPEQALAAWVDKWRDGQRQITVYDRRMDRAQGLSC